MKLTKSRIIVLAVLASLDIIFFSTVNPTKAPSLLLFAGFALLGCNLLGLWYALLWVSRNLVSLPKGRIRKPTVVATIVSLVLLALQSIGQLTLRDVLAIAALTAIVWFYASYSRDKRT